MIKLLVLALFAAFFAFAWLSLPSLDQAQAPGAGQQAASGSGVLQSIDKGKGVVTIRHGPLPALNMMPMTMPYAVKDKNQLANLQPMQEVQFRVVYDGKDYLITDIR